MKRPGARDELVRSVQDPGPPTLRELVSNLPANIQEAARLEAAALEELRELHPLPVPKEEPMLKYYVRQARAEKAAWREYLTVYRTWLDTHPELADRPVGTRCAHAARGCCIGHPLPELVAQVTPEREAGSDDGDEYPQDRRLPREKETEFPF